MERGAGRFLPPDGRTHVAAQIVGLGAFVLGVFVEPGIDPAGGDVAVIWGVVVIVLGSAAALVGTVVGLVRERLRRTARWATVTVGLVVGAGAALAVLLLGGDGTPCSLGAELCAPAPREWLAGLAGLETALVLHAVTSWNAVQLRRGWTAAQATRQP